MGRKQETDEKKMKMISKTKVLCVIGILCMVLVVITLSERKSSSLDGYSSDDELNGQNVERFKRAAAGKKHHNHHKKKHGHHNPKNNTVTGKSDTGSNKNESIYANKKIDVNQKAQVIGAEMKSQKPVKHVKVKATEVADEGSKTGVIVAVVLVLVTALGVGAAVFIVKKKRAQGK